MLCTFVSTKVFLGRETALTAKAVTTLTHKDVKHCVCAPVPLRGEKPNWEVENLTLGAHCGAGLLPMQTPLHSSSLQCLEGMWH